MAIRRVRAPVVNPDNPDEVLVDDGRPNGVNTGHLVAAAGGGSFAVVLPIVLGWLLTWPIQSPNGDQVNALAGLLVIVAAAVWGLFAPSAPPLITPMLRAPRRAPSLELPREPVGEVAPPHPQHHAANRVWLPREVAARLAEDLAALTQGRRIARTAWETLYWAVRRALHTGDYPEAVHLRVAAPTYFDHEGEEVMFQLRSTQVGFFPIVAQDAAGDVVAAPQGDTFTVTCSDPTKANVTVDALPQDAGPFKAGAPAVKVQPLARSAPGMSFTLTDSSGLTGAPVAFEVVDDLTPKTIGADVVNVVTENQDEPPA